MPYQLVAAARCVRQSNPRIGWMEHTYSLCMTPMDLKPMLSRLWNSGGEAIHKLRLWCHSTVSEMRSGHLWARLAVASAVNRVSLLVQSRRSTLRSGKKHNQSSQSESVIQGTARRESRTTFLDLSRKSRKPWILAREASSVLGITCPRSQMIISSSFAAIRRVCLISRVARNGSI